MRPNSSCLFLCSPPSQDALTTCRLVESNTHDLVSTRTYAEALVTVTHRRSPCRPSFSIAPCHACAQLLTSASAVAGGIFIPPLLVQVRGDVWSRPDFSSAASGCSGLRERECKTPQIHAGADGEEGRGSVMGRWRA